MEYLSGKIKIKDIFTHQNNWFNFYNKYKNLIRKAITENVTKVLSCRTPLLGFHYYGCSDCANTKKVPHSCKSRFCTSCGKAATDQWISKTLKILPDVRYQHITFTLPSVFWLLFQVNRKLIGEIPKIAAQIILDVCKNGKGRKHYLPGIFLAIHSYGRALNFNIHIHLCVTVGGFNASNNYIEGTTINHQILKNMWKYRITNLLRKYFKNNSLLPYPAVREYFKNYTIFNKWLDFQYQKTWNVYLQKVKNGAKKTTEYLGKYLKKPPLAEARIDAYDGNLVTFTYHDHNTKTNIQKTLPVEEFIKTLIIHIPDKYFRMVRYFGFLANRVRTKFLKQFNQNTESKNYKPPTYVERFIKAFHKHPLKCSCGNEFLLLRLTFAVPIPVLVCRHNAKAASFSGP